MTAGPRRHTLTRMPDGRLLGLAEDGSWWLWDYDPDAADLTRQPAVRAGRWSTIDTTHQLLPVRDGRVLDWTPVDGRWRLWDYRPDEADVLTGPNADGRWSTIGPGHELVVLADGTVLDRCLPDDTWRLWSYDPGDAEPGRLANRRRVPGQPWDVLDGPLDQGSWRVRRPAPGVRVPPDHHLVPLPDGVVLDWAPDGHWRTWDVKALLAPAADAVVDGEEPRPLRAGWWPSIQEGRVLVPTLDHRVIDWWPVTGDVRLWAYDEAGQELRGGAPERTGLWRTLNTLPDRLQFRLRAMLEHDSTDDLLQGGDDEVYLQVLGLDSAMVTLGPDGRPTVATIASPVVGDISDDAVRGPWRAEPKVMVEFDVHRPADWPRTFTVTLLIVEQDDDDLADAFADLQAKVGKAVEDAAVSAAAGAVGAVVGSVVLPGIGTAVGAAVGALVGAGYELVVDQVQRGLGDDVLPPKSLTLTVPDPRTMWLHGDVGRAQVLRVEGDGAVYDIEYDWAWA